ncbi:GreA/GreB family elongation factor [Patescibacteria group bacterium]
MQAPKRKSQLAHQHAKANDNHLSEGAVRKLEGELTHLQERTLPRAKEDVTRAREMGDLSENAAYSEAKGRLMRTNTRILEIQDKLANAIIIEPGPDEGGKVRIGSVVTVEVNGKTREYEITGSDETDPAAGKISHASPLGALLIGKKTGDDIQLKNGERSTHYSIKIVE